ncbi:uncharacterized protein METZ01_LOCUS311069, partial [marine metagenome]
MVTMLTAIALMSLSVACSSNPTPVTEAKPVRPGVDATNAFYYYADVEAAWGFYTKILGLQTVADYGFAK